MASHRQIQARTGLPLDVHPIDRPLVRVGQRIPVRIRGHHVGNHHLIGGRRRRIDRHRLHRRRTVDGGLTDRDFEDLSVVLVRVLAVVDAPVGDPVALLAFRRARGCHLEPGDVREVRDARRIDDAHEVPALGDLMDLAGPSVPDQEVVGGRVPAQSLDVGRPVLAHVEVGYHVVAVAEDPIDRVDAVDLGVHPVGEEQVARHGVEDRVLRICHAVGRLHVHEGVDVVGQRVEVTVRTGLDDVDAGVATVRGDEERGGRRVIADTGRLLGVGAEVRALCHGSGPGRLPDVRGVVSGPGGLVDLRIDHDETVGLGAVRDARGVGAGRVPLGRVDDLDERCRDLLHGRRFELDERHLGHAPLEVIAAGIGDEHVHRVGVVGVVGARSERDRLRVPQRHVTEVVGPRDPPVTVEPVQDSIIHVQGVDEVVTRTVGQPAQVSLPQLRDGGAGPGGAVHVAVHVDEAVGACVEHDQGATPVDGGAHWLPRYRPDMRPPHRWRGLEESVDGHGQHVVTIEHSDLRPGCIEGHGPEQAGWQRCCPHRRVRTTHPGKHGPVTFDARRRHEHPTGRVDRHTLGTRDAHVCRVDRSDLPSGQPQRHLRRCHARGGKGAGQHAEDDHHRQPRSPASPELQPSNALATPHDLPLASRSIRGRTAARRTPPPREVRAPEFTLWRRPPGSSCA